MPEVPLTNLNAYYANTSAGNVIKSAVIDPALQDMVQAINDNFAEFQALKLALELPIPDQSIVTRHLRNLAVTTPKLAQFAVTADKIADGSITLAKLADLVVTAAKIANGTITEQKYATGSVSSRAIGTGEVKATNIDPSLLASYGDIATNAKFEVIDGRLLDMAFIVKSSGGNDSASIQNAINSNASKIFLPDQTYIMNSPVLLRSNLEIVGSEKTVIINNLDRTVYPLGTFNGLFMANLENVTGSYTNITQVSTLSVIASELDKTVTLSNGALVAAGDFLSIDNFSAFVVSVSSNVITLDRQVPYTIASGVPVYKSTALAKNIKIRNLTFDFNGTIDNPRYGFGIIIHQGTDILIENVRGVNIGSKLIELNRCVDSTLNNVRGTDGTRPNDGGHSYVIRLTRSNDCKVIDAYGKNLRHVVDINAACRNLVVRPTGINNLYTDVLTHYNGAKNNRFTDITSINNAVSATSFTPAMGDTGNILDGGYIEDSTVCRPFDLIMDNSCEFKNITVNNRSKHVHTANGEMTYQRCTIKMNGSNFKVIRSEDANARRIIFDNCTIELGNELGNGGLLTDTGTAVTTMQFKNGSRILNRNPNTRMISGNNMTILELVDSNYEATQQTVDNSFAYGCSQINVYRSAFSFITSGLSIFGLNNGTVLRLDNIRVVNSTGVFRRYTTGDCSIIFGKIELTNSTLNSVANLINLRTIEAPELSGFTIPPTTGTWTKGAKLTALSPDAGGYAGQVCTAAGLPGTWKGFGLIQA